MLQSFSEALYSYINRDTICCFIDEVTLPFKNAIISLKYYFFYVFAQIVR